MTTSSNEEILKKIDWVRHAESCGNQYTKNIKAKTEDMYPGDTHTEFHKKLVKHNIIPEEETYIKNSATDDLYKCFHEDYIKHNEILDNQITNIMKDIIAASRNKVTGKPTKDQSLITYITEINKFCNPGSKDDTISTLGKNEEIFTKNDSKCVTYLRKSFDALIKKQEEEAEKIKKGESIPKPIVIDQIALNVFNSPDENIKKLANDYTELMIARYTQEPNSYLYEPVLSFVGILQALELGYVIKDSKKEYDMIISSAMTRTIMTALLVCIVTGHKEINIVPYISEKGNATSLMIGQYGDRQNVSVPWDILEKRIDIIKKWLNNNWITGARIKQAYDSLTGTNLLNASPNFNKINFDMLKNTGDDKNKPNTRIGNEKHFSTFILPNLKGKILAFSHGYMIKKLLNLETNPLNACVYNISNKKEPILKIAPIRTNPNFNQDIELAEDRQLCNLSSLKGAINIVGRNHKECYDTNNPISYTFIGNKTGRNYTAPAAAKYVATKSANNKYYDKYMKYKNKFLNLRKQIEEFNVINED